MCRPPATHGTASRITTRGNTSHVVLRDGQLQEENTSHVVLRDGQLQEDNRCGTV